MPICSCPRALDRHHADHPVPHDEGAEQSAQRRSGARDIGAQSLLETLLPRDLAVLPHRAARRPLGVVHFEAAACGSPPAIDEERDIDPLPGLVEYADVEGRGVEQDADMLFDGREDVLEVEARGDVLADKAEAVQDLVGSETFTRWGSGFGHRMRIFMTRGDDGDLTLPHRPRGVEAALHPQAESGRV